MATTQKYSVTVVFVDNHGVSRQINPIIEAPNETEARKIAQAQYPNASIRTVMKAR